MSKNPAKRNLGDHIKEGFKQIPKTYEGLYNQPGPKGMGGASTIPNNLRVIAKGNTSKGMAKQPASTRVGLAALGAASVTPIGPVAAFGIGVNKSVKAKAAANVPPAAPAAAPKLKIKQQGAAPSASAMPPLPATPTSAAMPPLPATPRGGVVPKTPPRTNLKIASTRTPGAPRQ